MKCKKNFIFVEILILYQNYYDHIIGKTKRIFLQKRSGSKLAKTNRTCFNVIKTKIRTENSEDLTIKQQGANTRF